MDKNRKVELKLPESVGHVRFEVDNQTNRDGGIVSLNLEKMDKNGNWIDNDTVTFKEFDAICDNDDSVSDYVDALRVIAKDLNALFGLDRSSGREVFVAVEVSYRNEEAGDPSVIGIYPSESVARAAVRSRLDSLERYIRDTYGDIGRDCWRSDAESSIWCSGRDLGWSLSINKAYYDEGKE